MAGHSKWANIKHRKARVDAQKGKIFTKIAREIIVAAREGGGDPDANFALRLIMQKAREANMPNDNIMRAVKRGTGELGGGNFESLFYEGYGPGGVALMLDINTDNRNRTAGDIRHILSKHNGSLGESGCVGWMFKRKGYISLERTEGLDVDGLLLLALEAGAEDVLEEEDIIEVTTAPEDLERVRKALENAGMQVAMSEVAMLPDTEVKVEDKEVAEKLLRLVDALEDHDDVQNVYTNVDIQNDILEGMDR
jgi:YebC/PmpR family DNA-binding regulatory protein